MKYIQPVIFILLTGCVVFFGCRKEESYRTSGGQVSFTVDTLHFDTVFTQIGSATRFFKVKNPYSQSLKISRIYLENNTNSTFRINIDGVPGYEFKDVTVPPNDSIYVFAEVTVNPNAPVSTSPFVIDANMVFDLNGAQQRVVLEAFGQNANYLPNRFGKGTFPYLNAHGGTVSLSDPKPYVVYGFLVLDSVNLIIPAGTRIYVHGGLAKFPDSTKAIYNDGIIYATHTAKIDIQGTVDKPVTIQGDRLEPEFASDDGQWGGIILSSGSAGNSISYATIKNAKFGINVDSSASLVIKNSKIYNITGSSLHGYHSSISAENCLFYNTGSDCVQLEYGGNYDLTYCTMASYSKDALSLNVNNFSCVNSDCSLIRPNNLTNLSVVNCILYGSKEDMIGLNNPSVLRARPDIQFNINFKNSIVRVKNLLDPTQPAYYPDFLKNCINCIQTKSGDRIFTDAGNNNYRPDSLSIALKNAFPVQGVAVDIENKPRNGTAPTIGAYENFK